jgi:HSP20 family protein
MSDRDLAPAKGVHSLSGDDRDPFTAFRRQVDRVFDSFVSPVEPRSFAPRGSAGWLPLDLNETAQAYMVTAELPGIDEKDVEVTLKDNTLTIRGEKRDERGGEESDRVYIERSYGRFERTIPFDTEVDADMVQASARNGVLTVTLPKNPQAHDKTRRIEVKRRDS